MRLSRPAAAAALVALALVAVPASAVLAPPGAVFADDVDDAVADLEKLVDEGNEANISAKITSFEKKRDGRIDTALMAIVKSSKLEGPAKDAMRVLAMHQCDDYLGWAKTNINSKRMIEDKAARHGAMMTSLALAGDALKPYLPILDNCIEEWMTKKGEVSSKAVLAYGAVRDKAVVNRLIAILAETDDALSRGGGGPSRQSKPVDPGGKGGGGADASVHVGQTRDAIFAALKNLTGSDGGDTGTWKSWWLQNRDTFQFRQPEPDWANLSEFIEDFTGFTLRKPPPGKGWVFEKCPIVGGTARLKFMADKDMVACVDVMSIAKGPHTDAASYAKSVDMNWRGSCFREFVGGGEPAVKPRKMGGREVLVLTAHGQGTSAWKSWDVYERRAYVMTAPDGSYVMIDAAARSDFDGISSLWATLDSAKFKPRN